MFNSWRDATPQEFFKEVNEKANLRTKLDFPALTNTDL
jgi:hypothetical protein